MPENMRPDASPRKSGRLYKYFFILVCVVVAWLALRVEERPDQRAARRARRDESATVPVPAPAPALSPVAAKAVALTAATFSQAVSGGVYVVDFWAEWCGPCRTQGPILEQFAKSHAGSVGVGKIDVDSEGDLARRFGISSIPTIIVFKDGREETRFVGVTSRETLSDAVEALM